MFHSVDAPTDQGIADSSFFLNYYPTRVSASKADAVVD
jgi:hypothetical protein